MAYQSIVEVITGDEITVNPEDDGSKCLRCKKYFYDYAGNFYGATKIVSILIEDSGKIGEDEIAVNWNFLCKSCTDELNLWLKNKNVENGKASNENTTKG